MASPELLTIDELAHRVGMTTRNIRAHQTRGLLPPPTLAGRTGRYGPEHVERLLTIRRLQEQGLNLQAIGMVLDGASPEMARVRSAVLEPFATEDPVDEPLVDVVRRLGGGFDPSLLKRAVSLRLLEVRDDVVRVALPTVLRRGEQLLELGVPVEPQLSAVEAVDEHVRAVAVAYLELAREHLIATLVGDGALDPDALRARVEQLRAIAADVLLSLFHRAMTEETEQLVREVLPEA